MGSQAAEPFASSVCHGCQFLRVVGTKRGSAFLQCMEGSLPKYGPQPVSRCLARRPSAPSAASERDEGG
ncbi:MAG: hypothetical protein IPI49_25970 [Myxococcales bacterium]|nr:hypothetical protein [Myxococcales bacterium]HRC58271.1 hypothetical protein [Kofleriaceae bacterium]